MSASVPEGVLQAVVLAAGKGTRMKSDLAKVLHPMAGKPLLAHVLGSIRRAGFGRILVVVGHQASRVQAAFEDPDLQFVIQQPQHGTGHAVKVAAPYLQPAGLTVVLNGDVPLLRAATLERIVRKTAADGWDATILSCVVPDAGSYGRIVRDDSGQVARIVEARDATDEELAIGEYNTGVFCFRTGPLLEVLDRLTNENDQKEYYLTDCVALLLAAGYRVAAVPTDDPDEVVGVNDPGELAAAEKRYLLLKDPGSSAHVGQGKGK